MNKAASTSSPTWSPMTKLVVALIVIVVISALLIRFQALIVPLAIAFIIAYLFQPFAAQVDRVPRLSWRMAVGVTYLLIIMILASLLTLGGWGIVSQIQSLIALIEQSLSELPALLNDVALWITERLQAFPIPIPIDLSTLDLESVGQELLSYIQPLLGSTGQILGSLATGAAGFFGWAVFSLLISYFILAESGGLRKNLIKIEIPGYQDDISRLGKELNRIWNAFLRGQMIVFTLAFLFYLFVLSVLGVRYALGLAILAGLSKFLPYIGPTIVWVVLLLVSYFQAFKLFGMDPLAYTLLVYFVALIFDQILDGLITPRIMADALSVHPAAVLVSALVFADLIGILGIIIAAPMLATFFLFGRYIMWKMFDRDPWAQKDFQRGTESSIRLVETVRVLFKRLPFKRKQAKTESGTVKSPKKDQ